MGDNSPVEPPTWPGAHFEEAAMARPTPSRALLRIVVTAVVAAVVATGATSLAHPRVAAASTADTMESTILSLVNGERTQRGLVPLRLHAGLVDLAGDRAASMAAIGSLQHIGCLMCAMNARGIQAYSASEVIASTTYPWGAEAAKSLVRAWKSSPTHWALLMSRTSNYIGVGVAYRSSAARTYASAVMTESRDRTPPWARVSAGSVAGTTVAWSWTGADTLLQTHTAGLRNFDVEYRVGSGTWTTIRSGTTARSLSLGSRAHGHWYGLRVRARDNLGYVSGYSAELRVWVP
jgi:uncharacterized protein YkwD